VTGQPALGAAARSRSLRGAAKDQRMRGKSREAAEASEQAGSGSSTAFGRGSVGR